MPSNTKVYCFKLQLENIKPVIWREFLIQETATLKDLHYVIQILMGWTDYHLNEFTIKGQGYTIPNRIGNVSGGGISGSNIKLQELKLKQKSKILYDYDFTARWKFELKLESIEAPVGKKLYPICVFGERASPDEECGGPETFMIQQDHWFFRSDEVMLELLEAVVDEDNADKKISEVCDTEELEEAVYWMEADKYEFEEINRFLKLYAENDDRWLEAFEE